MKITGKIIMHSKSFSNKRRTQRISIGIKTTWILVYIEWRESEFSISRGKVWRNIWRLDCMAMEIIDVIVVAFFIKLYGSIISWNAILLRKSVRGCRLLLICLF
jgi:hypothetical protein